MRTKNLRKSTKSSSQKQTTTNESSGRQIPQRSKRHRKSSTSSNESSDDEKPLKPTRTSISKDDSPETHKTSESSETTKSPKVAETKKLQHSSSNKQSRKKSGTDSHKEEDTRNSVKKSRRHERTRDDKDDKTNKGKSKSKNRSKNEKQPQIQDVQTKSESEISENVQVTTQSPQANTDIPVDNDTERDENESSVPQHVRPTESNTKHDINSDSNDSKDNHEYKEIVNDETSPNVEDGMVMLDVGAESMEWQPVAQEIVLEVLPIQDDSEILDYQEEVLQTESNLGGSSNGTSDNQGHGESRSKSSSPIADMSSNVIDPQTVPSVADDSNNVGGLPLHSDEDSRSVDAIVLHESSNTPPRDNKFNLTDSYASDVHHIESVNNDIQSMKDKVGEMFETPTKREKKQHWGSLLVGLEYIKPSMRNITIDTIKEFCPTVALLEESEIRLTAEHREKKVDRRISMETKSDDEHSRKYDTQSSHEEITSETDNSNIIALNRKISIVEDTASKLRPPPSPARNPVSSILYITNLVRPFTLKQLKELLERTGRIKDNGFWTDRIKSKCIVQYASLDDAEATRNALHKVNWPIGNGKQLMIEYSTPEEFEKARNPAPAALDKPSNTEKENLDLDKQIPNKRSRHEEPERVPKERERHRSEGRTREWDTRREDTRNKRSRSRRHSRNREVRHDSRDRNDRRRGRRSLTPPDYRSKKPKIKEEEPPQKMMDDLFHKTKAIPSIYWLPLNPEEIATKQQERLLRMAEHKRRIEESTRIRVDHGRGAPFRRRYD